jgi:hypothetical protein
VAVLAASAGALASWAAPAATAATAGTFSRPAASASAAPVQPAARAAASSSAPATRPAVSSIASPAQAGAAPREAIGRVAACEGEGEGAGPSTAEAAHVVSEGFEGAAAAAKDLGLVASAVGDEEAAAGLEGIAPGLEAAAAVASYGFAAAAFSEANAAFGYGGRDPVDGDFTAIFTPVFVHLAVVKAPSAQVAGAFAALNGLFDTETRFAEVVVALRVSLDRADGAAAAGDPIWQARQLDASANDAREAASLLESFSRLRADVALAFVADGLSLDLPPQFAAAQSRLARRLPAEIPRLLAAAARALRPQGSPEVKTLSKLILDTGSFEQALADAAPTSLDLPAAIDSATLDFADDRAVGALRSYADSVLNPAPATVHAQLVLARSDCGGGSGGASAASFGEPHEITFGGADYEFQAAGEFTLVRSTTDNLDIQIREQPFPGSADTAVNIATAMRVGSTIVELAGGPSGNLLLWIDRRPVPLASQALAGGGTLTSDDPRLATVTWPDGTRATVFSTLTIAIAHQTVTCNESSTIYVEISVPRSQYGHLSGLLGDTDQTPFSDLAGGDGVPYSIDEIVAASESVHNYDVLYHQFGQSWRVRQDDSLFASPRG